MLRRLLTSGDPDACHAAGLDRHRRGCLTGAAVFYQEALRLRPGDALAWTNLGLIQLARDDVPEAEGSLREAVRLAPAFAAAHSAMGQLHYLRGRVAEAETCFRLALRLDPAHAGAMINLGIALQAQNALGAAEVCYREALAKGAPPAAAHNNLGMLMLEQGRPGAAEAHCRESRQYRPDLPDSTVNLAMALLLTGRLSEGWEIYEARWRLPHGARAEAAWRSRRWHGTEPVAGKTIILWAEQGFGDTLQFCRYAPLVAALGARVILAVPPALIRLMRGLPGVESVIELGGPRPRADFHCPLMSLPRAFGTTLETVPAAPYLDADPAPWRDRLPPGPRVGLVWAGGERPEKPQAAAIDQRRSMRLDALAPLLSVPGVTFVSLQLGPPVAEIRQTVAYGNHLPALIDAGPVLHDFADTAALIQALDLVIAVDTAVAHLAGALGKPVWLLNRFDTCWRWLLDRDGSPWYPSMRQFRQTAPGDWADVIARVTVALETRTRAGEQAWREATH